MIGSHLAFMRYIYHVLSPSAAMGSPWHMWWIDLFIGYIMVAIRCGVAHHLFFSPYGFRMDGSVEDGGLAMLVHGCYLASSVAAFSSVIIRLWPWVL